MSYFTTEGKSEILATYKGIAQQLAEVLSVRLVINRALVNESISCAQSSIKFYDMSGPNHYKELGHVMFWLAKLKPIRVVSIRLLASEIIRFGFSLTDRLMGTAVYEESERGAVQFPVNEYVAFLSMTTLLRSCQERGMEPLSEALKSDYHNLISESDKNRENMQEDIVRSLRYYSYSSRVLAVTIESLMRVGQL
jgi:hypothetical protein